MFDFDHPLRPNPPFSSHFLSSFYLISILELDIVVGDFSHPTVWVRGLRFFALSECVVLRDSGAGAARACLI